MRLPLALAAATAMLSDRTATLAAPAVHIRGAAARVIVIPEPRQDIRVVVVRANPAYPLRITRFAGAVFVDGDVRHRTRHCRLIAGQPTVEVRGRGHIAYAALPRLVIHTPMDARVSADEAVFGAIGRSRSLDLSNQGCGDWLIGNVAARLRLSQSGAGALRAGAAGSADLSVAGSGRIATGQIGGGLTALSTGAGSVSAASASGPLDMRIAGSGDIVVAGGTASAMAVSVAGSGRVRFGGVARRLDAQVAGSGVVDVARVTGPVVKHLYGAGQVRAGRQPVAGRPTAARPTAAR